MRRFRSAETPPPHKTDCLVAVLREVGGPFYFTCAFYVAPLSEEDDFNYEGGDLEEGADGTLYWPKGWYEQTQHDEIAWRLEDEVIFYWPTSEIREDSSLFPREEGSSDSFGLGV